MTHFVYWFKLKKIKFFNPSAKVASPSSFDAAVFRDWWHYPTIRIFCAALRLSVKPWDRDFPCLESVYCQYPPS